jgi:hypothetical protein
MTAMTRGVPGAKGSHKYSDDEYAAGHKTAKKGKGEYAEDTYPPVYPPGYPDDEFVPGVPGKGSKKAPCEYYTDETYTTSSGSKKGSHKYPDYEYVPGPGGKGKGAFSKKSKKGKGGCSSSEKGSKKGGVDNPAPAPRKFCTADELVLVVGFGLTALTTLLQILTLQRTIHRETASTPLVSRRNDDAIYYFHLYDVSSNKYNSTYSSQATYRYGAYKSNDTASTRAIACASTTFAVHTFSNESTLGQDRS